MYKSSDLSRIEFKSEEDYFELALVPSQKVGGPLPALLN